MTPIRTTRTPVIVAMLGCSIIVLFVTAVRLRPVLNERLEIRSLIKSLGSNDPGLSYWAGPKLARIGPPAVPQIVQATTDSNANLRARAVRVLGSIDPVQTESVEAMIGCLKDMDADVRLQAAWALRESGVRSRKVLVGFTAALSDSDSRVCEAAVWGIGCFGPEAADVVDLVSITAFDSCPHTRWHCAWALGQIGPVSESVVRTLIALLQDESLSVRGAACDALGLLEGGASSAVPTILPLLHGEDRFLQLKAARALWRIERQPEALACITDSLKGADEEVRKQAAYALAGLGHDALSAIPDLLNALTDNSDAVRTAVQYAIEQLER